jgi:hypothetical protein
VRYRERTTAERANAPQGRVRRPLRARARARQGDVPLMFGVLALAVDQLMRLLGG